MIKQTHIEALVGNHVAPYIYGHGFIPGITPVPYSGPYWDHKETEAAIGTFLNGNWITAGDSVHEFENRFAEMFHSKYALMVNSGSSANLVMVAALKKYYGWEDGDEIIVSPVGFPMTISVIYQNRLKPVFVDIEWDTLNFDLGLVENSVTAKTKAIFLSPVLGNPPNMDRLLYICSKYDIKLIGDNCDSLGSKWGARFLTEYCVASSNSFYPAHHISTGEGGMVCCDDKELMKIMISLAWWGRDCTCVGANNMLKDGSCGKRFDKWLDTYDGVVDHKYIFSNMGYNLKPLDLQGAIGLAQLEKFPLIETYRNLTKIIIERMVLENIKNVRGVVHFPEATPCWFGIPFICEEEGLKHRLVAHLEKNKIQTRNYFAGNILMHKGYSFLADYRDYPEANKVLDNVFFLGCPPFYMDPVFDYLEKIIKAF